MTSTQGNSIFVRAAILLGLALAVPTTSFAQNNHRILATYNRGSQPSAADFSNGQPRLDSPARSDRQVRPAGFQTDVANQPITGDPGLLAPPTRQDTKQSLRNQSERVGRSPKFALPKIESFTTAGAGLAIVVGLFLVCMWLLRRSGPKPTSPLPREVVSVLGRLPLAGRNFAHLLQIGNKLVLVAITPEGVSPISEITDPLEVQRLVGLCMQSSGQSTSAEFQDVLKHLTKEPASGFLGNEASSSYAANRR